VSGAARAFGGPVARGELRRVAADFEVTEELGFEPDGAGQHVWLGVVKEGVNTADVAQALARRAGVGARAVGFAGRKDRWARARQWFSLHLAGRIEPDWRAPQGAHWRVEVVTRHGRKLRPGSHRGNRFRLRVRRLAGDRAAVDERLRQVEYYGCPNYFGGQRFGVDGANLERARAALRRRRPRAPAMAVSAARAWLFNRVLAYRVADGTWDTARVGEPVMLAGTRSIFCYDGADSTVASRVAALDLDPTGPLWGRGEIPIDAAMAALERDWLADEAELCAGLERLGSRAERRPLRTPAEAFDWAWDGGDLVVGFTLRRGAFATSLLAEVLDWGEEATPG